LLYSSQLKVGFIVYHEAFGGLVGNLILSTGQFCATCKLLKPYSGAWFESPTIFHMTQQATPMNFFLKFKPLMFMTSVYSPTFFRRECAGIEASVMLFAHQ